MVTIIQQLVKMLHMPNKKRKHSIHVEASMRVAQGDFDFIGEEDYGKVIPNKCAEGHDIRKGYLFRSRSTGEEVVLGGTCQWKVSLFRRWKNLKSEDITPRLLNIGEKIWTIDNNNLWNLINEILEKKKMSMMFDNVPPANQQDDFYKNLSTIIKEAYAIRAARAAEEVRKRKAESLKVVKCKIDNRQENIFEKLKSIQFNNEYDEKVRLSLINGYIKYGSWKSEEQINLAEKLSKKQDMLPKKDERQEEIFKKLKSIQFDTNENDEKVRLSLINGYIKYGSWKSEEQINLAEKLSKKQDMQPSQSSSEKTMIKIITHFIKDLDNDVSRAPEVIDRERGFLQNMIGLINGGGKFTPKQAGWLKGISRRMENVNYIKDNKDLDFSGYIDEHTDRTRTD